MQCSHLNKKNMWIVLSFLLVCRLISMYVMSLNDTTEARYGEIARIMLETGNWVTPMQTYGIPFWAKPPLSTWLSAFSMKLFGVNELAARLPSLLLSIGVLGLVWNVAKKQSGMNVAITAVVVLAGSLFFMLDAGTVMTDPSLLFCITLSLVSFWKAISGNKFWSYIFFVGLGLGLLAKGPIAVVLTGMPIFIWTLWHKRWIALWQNLPWFKGTLLIILIAGPWYVLAEFRTPGFLNYFIIGEHFHRFLDPGWGGDKYGFAHVAPLGMIWAYAFLSILPWSIIGLAWVIRHYKAVPALCRDNDGWMSYLAICTLTPLVFFTFSSNIIYPYVFPSLPVFALLFAELTERAHALPKRFFSLASISGFLFLLVAVLFVFRPEWVEKSQHRIVAAYQNIATSSQSKLIYWAQKTEFSSQFYSRGQARATLKADELRAMLFQGVEPYVVVDLKYVDSIPNDLQKNLKQIDIIPILKNKFILFQFVPVKNRLINMRSRVTWE